MTLTDLLVGLTERGTTAGHDVETETIGGYGYLTCDLCGLETIAMIVNDLGGWRISPDIGALDRPCQ